MHFTNVSSNDESDSDVDENNECVTDEEESAQNSSIDHETELDTTIIGKCSDRNLESPSVEESDPSMLEMIMIKDVSIGAEVRTWTSFYAFAISFQFSLL